MELSVRFSEHFLGNDEQIELTMQNKIPHEISPEDIRLRIQSKVKNPNVGQVITSTVKDGPQSYIYATIYEIIDPADSSHHHWCLKLDSCNRGKRVGWTFKADKSLTVEGAPSLEVLANLIKATIAGQLAQKTGDFRLIPAEQLKSIRGLLRFARHADSAKRLQVIQAVLEELELNDIEPAEWLKVFESGADGVRQTIAVAARLVEYKRVRQELVGLIEANALEGPIQKILTSNPWLFGSEYSELLSRRSWTRDDRLDFMLRRTVDNYLEIIEIKTPFHEPLLKYDGSHDSYAPSSALSLALGQVVRYIEEIERDRDSILAKDKCDTLKVRARLIIGRDGDEEMMAALRNFNGHLHRIEVLTFDQLIRIADRVLSVFEESLQTASIGDLPPF
jgi:Shedu protein SduA, C-terminal